MSYKALYRTYRPQTFEDVAGQSHVTITLKNAIKENRIAHGVKVIKCPDIWDKNWYEDQNYYR